MTVPGQQKEPSGVRLTALAVAALGLLCERPMHPYEMYQVLMHRHEDRTVKVRPGTLYHAVGRLADAGLVQACGTDREGNRPERTSYAVLPAGREALEARLRDMLARPVNEYPCFPQALAEAHNLPADVVVGLLSQRQGVLEEQFEALEAEARLAESRGAPARFWIDIRYQQTLLRAELDWIAGLRRDIASDALPW